MEPTLFLLPLSLRLPFVLVDKKQQSTEGEGETSPAPCNSPLKKGREFPSRRMDSSTFVLSEQACWCQAWNALSTLVVQSNGKTEKL